MRWVTSQPQLGEPGYEMGNLSASVGGAWVTSQPQLGGSGYEMANLSASVGGAWV